MSSFPCSSCGKNHPKQAFISHASSDREVANQIGEACCKSEVAPYLFEFSADYSARIGPAETLAKRISESAIHFILISPSISKYWTQAWIGFEIGVSRGADTADIKARRSTPYFSKKIIAIDNIKQGVPGSLPSLDALLLFDFSSNERWSELQKAIRFLTPRYSNTKEIRKVDYTKPAANESLGDIGFAVGNAAQEALLKANVKCENCLSEYEAWIAIKDAPKLDKAFNQFSEIPVVLAECTIECPSCDKMVTRVFRQALGVKRLPHTFMSSTPNFLRPFLRIFSRRK